MKKRHTNVRFVAMGSLISCVYRKMFEQKFNFFLLMRNTIATNTTEHGMSEFNVDFSRIYVYAYMLVKENENKWQHK